MKPRYPELVEKFRKEVSQYFDDETSEDTLLYEESDFHSITAGWAMAQGMNPSDAYEFASYVRYETDYA